MVIENKDFESLYEKAVYLIINLYCKLNSLFSTELKLSTFNKKNYLRKILSLLFKSGFFPQRNEIQYEISYWMEFEDT
jgi:transcription initiation factor IIE alpha subunit